MEKLSLWSLFIVALWIVIVKCSEFNVALSDAEKEASSDFEALERISTSFESVFPDNSATQSSQTGSVPKIVRYFRMFDHHTVYYDDELNDEIPSNFFAISARYHLYKLLFELSASIERYDTSAFADLIEKHKEDIGFCMRFHLVVLVLNLFSSNQYLDGIKSSCFTTFIDLITGINSSNEVSNEIVLDQFDCLYEKITKFIESLHSPGSTGFSLDPTEKNDLTAALRKYINAESFKIPVSNI